MLDKIKWVVGEIGRLDVCYIVQNIGTEQTVMEQVNISEFRANILKYLKQPRSGNPFSVTSNGEVLATVSSPEYLKKTAQTSLKELAVTAKIGDIVTPSDEWDASS